MRIYQTAMDAHERRNRRIFEDWRHGKSLRELAQEHGVSRQRARQIVLREQAREKEDASTPAA